MIARTTLDKSAIVVRASRTRWIPSPSFASAIGNEKGQSRVLCWAIYAQWANSRVLWTVGSTVLGDVWTNSHQLR